MARPEIKITKAMINKAERLAAQGLTLEQIASCLGISYDTLNRNKKKLGEFSEALKRGKAAGIQQVTNALFEKAIDGDNTAIIFYLKCRDRESWNDQAQQKESGTSMADELRALADKLPS